MHNGYWIRILAVMLLLAAGVCAVSAVSLSVGSVTLANLDEQKDVTLSLDNAPAGGMAGYILTFTIADNSVAKIVGVKCPSWAVPDFCSSSVSGDGKTGTLKVADVRSTSGATPSLGSVTVQGLKYGFQTTITVTVNELDDTGGNLVPVASASGTISVAQAPGSISVTSTPTGASIYVNGVLKGTTGTTPLIISDLTPKTYEVKATLAGYADWVGSVVVESGKTTSVSITMQLPVTIRVTTTPGGCDVYFTLGSGSEVKMAMGTPEGSTGTRTYTGNPPGAYTVRVAKTGYLGKALSRILSSGATSTFTFSLSQAVNVEEPYPGIHVNSVGVDGQPIDGARVVLDGVPQENVFTPATIELNAGVHSITVNLDGYMIPDPYGFTIEDNHAMLYKTFTLVKTSPSKSCLWEGTHTLTPMTLNPATGLKITKITSDEPTAYDTGSGGIKYSPDAFIDGNSVFRLRAERSGSGDGRLYQISIEATNNGNKVTGFVTVCVPLDQSVPKCSGGDPNRYIQKDQCCCIDSGQKYDATKKN